MIFRTRTAVASLVGSLSLFAVFAGCDGLLGGGSSARSGQLGDACNPDDSTFCRFGFFCQSESGTCQDEENAGVDGAGFDCRNNNDCVGDLKCQPETNTCQIVDGDGIPGPKLLGNDCSVDEDCDEGLICQYASETCQPPGGEDIEGLGRSCITNGDCGLGELYCQDESLTCQPIPPPAE
jgi:hypothetical protein